LFISGGISTFGSRSDPAGPRIRNWSSVTGVLNGWSLSSRQFGSRRSMPIGSTTAPERMIRIELLQADRGGQTCWPCADDHHVELHALPLDIAHQQLPVRRPVGISVLALISYRAATGNSRYCSSQGKYQFPPMNTAAVQFLGG
jgi:hypothetical protein